MIPNAPLGFLRWEIVSILLAVAGIVYASIIAFKQTDGKRLVAYSSIAHVGLIAAGIFAWTLQGLQGAMIQMLSHGINLVGMFFIWDIISRRLNTRDITQLGGIAKVAPKFAVAFLIIVLGTVALPLTNGFIGEFLLLRMYKGVMQGETNALTATFTDIHGSELLVLIIICALIIVIGVYPQPLLHISEASVNNLAHAVYDKILAKQY